MIYQVSSFSAAATYNGGYIAPVEDPNLPPIEVWKYFSDMWKTMCNVRDTQSSIVQCKLIERRKVSECNAERRNNFFRLDNALKFVDIMIEYCNMYLPQAVGELALYDIFSHSNICASMERELSSSETLRLISENRCPVFYERDHHIFGYSFLSPYDGNRMTPIEFADHAQEYSNIHNGNGYGYSEILRGCHRDWVSYRVKDPINIKWPIIYVNPYVINAFINADPLKANRSSVMQYHSYAAYVHGYAALYLLIEMCHRHDYGNGSVDLLDAKLLWESIDTFINDDHYLVSYANFFGVAKKLVHGFYTM